MTLEVLPSARDVARRGAKWIAAQARLAIAARGRFLFGVSGGTTPSLMLSELAHEDMNWDCIEIFQVDERVAPPGDPNRNLTALRESLRAAPLAAARIHAMPVESDNLSDGANRYLRLLESIAGTPPVLDLAHLGLGADGHTASLVPGDPVLDVADVDVALTHEYSGWRRLTLTFAMLNRARQILWLVTGSQKAEALLQLLNGDQSIPAGRVRQDAALVLADRDAAQLIEHT